MWHLRAVFIAMAGILLLCVPETRADSLQLKNGNFVQGKYLGGTERAVQFEVNGKIRLYGVDEILSISFAAASADGGIPSNSSDPKPNANTEVNSPAKSNEELHTARSKQTNTRTIHAQQIAQGREPYDSGFQSLTERPDGASRSSCAIEANSKSKARVSQAVARSARVVYRRLQVLSD